MEGGGIAGSASARGTEGRGRAGRDGGRPGGERVRDGPWSVGRREDRSFRHLGTRADWVRGKVFSFSPLGSPLIPMGFPSSVLAIC